MVYGDWVSVTYCNAIFKKYGGLQTRYQSWPIPFMITLKNEVKCPLLYLSLAFANPFEYKLAEKEIPIRFNRNKQLFTYWHNWQNQLCQKGSIWMTHSENVVVEPLLHHSFDDETVDKSFQLFPSHFLLPVHRLSTPSHHPQVSGRCLLYVHFRFRQIKADVAVRLHSTEISY